MIKFYTVVILLFFVSFSFAQNSQTDKLVTKEILVKELTPVQKGDSFFVKPNIIFSQKKSFLTNVFRFLGVATAAYGIHHQSEHVGKTRSSSKMNILPEVGLGVFLTAPKLAEVTGNKKVYLQYSFYNKNVKLIATNIVEFNRRILKKNNGYMPGSIIKEDGFMNAIIVGNKSFDDNVAAEINIISEADNKLKGTLTFTKTPPAQTGGSDGLDNGYNSDNDDGDDGGGSGYDDGNDNDDGSYDGDDDGSIYDQVDAPDASDYFDNIDQEGGLAYIYNYDGKNGTITYTYDPVSDTWNIASWTGDYDPTTSTVISPTSITAANATQSFISVSGNTAYFLTYAGLEMLTYQFNPSTQTWNLTGGGALTAPLSLSNVAVPGDHSLPSKKLPANNNKNTQVGNLCVFKTMEWIEFYFGGNITEGSILLYYAQLKNDPTIIMNGFKGTINDLNNLIAHYFKSAPCTNVQVAINAGHPVMAFIYNSGSTTDGHEVFVTGYNNNGSYEYFDPESGTYKSAMPNVFNDLTEISGLK